MKIETKHTYIRISENGLIQIDTTNLITSKGNVSNAAGSQIDKGHNYLRVWHASREGSVSPEPSLPTNTSYGSK